MLAKVLNILIKLTITALEYIFVVLLAYAFDSSVIAIVGGAIVGLRTFTRFTK